MAYVKFKFPNLEKDKLPTDEQINSLEGDAKEIAKLCVQSVVDYLGIEDTNSTILVEDNNKRIPLYQYVASLEKEVELDNDYIDDGNIFIQEVNENENNLDNSK